MLKGERFRNIRYLQNTGEQKMRRIETKLQRLMLVIDKRHIG